MTIEKIVIDYLKNKLNIPAYAEKPENAPDEYLIVERVGGSISNFIRMSEISVRCISTTMYNASVLNDKVISAMLDIDDCNPISHCSLEEDSNYTDTTTKRYRNRSIFKVVYTE